MKKRRKIAIFLLIAMTAVILPQQKSVGYAASKYIPAETFAEMVLETCGIKVKTAENALEKAAECGLTEKKITARSYITRADAAILLAGAYEKMQGELPQEQLRMIKEYGRLSDLEDCGEEQADAMLRVYAAGIVPGYKRADYDPGREFRGKNKLTYTAAKKYLARLSGAEKRFLLSPDGQVLREEKLPANAQKYPYILANYPNSYYDWNLRFENSRQFKLGEMEEDNYYYPADAEKMPYFETRFVKGAWESAQEWAEKVKIYAELAFGADYRTIEQDDSWKSAMYALDADSSPAGSHEALRERIENYITKMKKNKTILEVETAAADPSSMYYFNGKFYIRLYVKYRIVSSKVTNPSVEDMIFKKSFNSIIFGDGVVSLNPVVKGEWREGYYDIGLSSPNEYSDGSDIGISERMIQDDYYIGTAVKQ